MLRISGHEFVERPPFDGRKMDRCRRLAEIVQALEFAASRCTEVERSLYKGIRQQQAHAMNLHANAQREKPRQATMADALPGSYEP